VTFFLGSLSPRFVRPPPSLRSARDFSAVPTQCPTVPPRFRAQAVTPLAPHLPQAVPPRRRPHATSARSLSRTRNTPPPPPLAHRSPIHHLRGATRRRRCSPTGGRFTTNRGAAPKLNRHHEAAPKPAAADRIPAKSGPLRHRLNVSSSVAGRKNLKPSSATLQGIRLEVSDPGIVTA